MDDIAKKFVELVKSSSNAVALTGAGISTESGIPDYRSPGTGLWDKMDQSVVSLEGFHRSPEKYYEYALEMYPIRRAAKPNRAHYLLAEMEKNDHLKGVITQNVDGLHYEAGSQTVHELHGSLRQVVCIECGNINPMDGIIERVIGGENPPLCEQCNGVYKPNAVFFGEALPRIPWEESVKLVKNTDLLIAIGSSLQVSPANALPDLALRSGSKLVIINLMPTPFDMESELLINEKIAEFSNFVLDILDAG